MIAPIQQWSTSPPRGGGSAARPVRAVAKLGGGEPHAQTHLFDRYIAVDWSGANTPRTGKDSIWIAELGRPSLNPPTRAAAMALIAERLREGGRIVLGFDFVFGYPRGTAAAIARTPSWRALWNAIADAIVDADDNTSNRFAVAEAFNRDLGAHHFWGHPHQHRYEHLQPKKPCHGYPAIPERRAAVALTIGPQPFWKLTGVGSVGSQSLLGIARLAHLKRAFPEIAIWPFETDFERALRPVTVVEIYPSLFPRPCRVAPPDREQVEICVQRFAELDAAGLLGRFLSAPPGIDRAPLIAEEGWIAGVGREHLLHQLEQAA